MEDDSPGDREDGRTFWSGLRTFLFGEENEATLRDEIEEAIENREGEVPRFGMRSRMVVCGDPQQVDLPEPGKSGLHDAVNRLEGIDKLSIVRFGPGDVVRHPLVGRIVEAYEGKSA